MRSPYRENARPSTRSVFRAPRRGEVIAGIGAVILLVAVTDRVFPAIARTELRYLEEPVPASERLTSAWSNDDGTRIVAVGIGGGVFERTNGLWHTLASGTDADLTAVSADGSAAAPVFAVGARGTILEVGQVVVPLVSNVDADLTAVVAARGEAFAVGHQGVILHVRPNPDHDFDAHAPERVVDRIASGGTDDLRAVAVHCPNPRECLVVATGAGGSIVEGYGRGHCQVASSRSDPRRGCSWSWSRRPSPTKVAIEQIRFEGDVAHARTEVGARLMRTPRGVWQMESDGDATPLSSLPVTVPVHVVHRRLFRADEELHDSSVALGESPRVRKGTEWIPLDAHAAVTVAARHAGSAYVLTNAGRLALVR